MASSMPLSTKFAYQSPLPLAHDKDAFARRFLQNLPQRYGFLAGKMPLVLFDLDKNEEEKAFGSRKFPKRYALTMWRHSNSDRLAAEEALKVELRRMLQQVDSSNRHMHPCSLVVQEMVPGEAVAVSLFATEKRRVTFIGCCKQAFDETTGHWNGGFISYKDQALLEQQYAGTIDALARFLHKKGYYGLIGADVTTDQPGRQLIIDINARVTGSYNLGCLQGHFVRRGLFEAVLLYRYISLAQETASSVFLIKSFTAEDSPRLEEFMKRLKEYARAG
ncbi:hypothetical protein VTN00DRAFT_10376 [Thermoascus crustaceus]|uniref:uncharacterized protein n=1 Tax=Thermoascus crustaceus TaxID=5088 RepID=UPI00374493F4